jgi:hypothetical protein
MTKKQKAMTLAAARIFKDSVQFKLLAAENACKMYRKQYAFLCEAVKKLEGK